LFGLNWRILTDAKGFLNTSLYFSRIIIGESTGQIYADPIYDRMPKPNEITAHYPIYLYDSDEKQFGMKTDFTYNLASNLTLHAGAAVQQVRSDVKLNLNGKDTAFVFDSRELVDNNKFVIVTPEEYNSMFNKKRMEYAGYAEASFSPAVFFDFNAGLRYEYDDMSKKNYFSPRFSGSYKIDPFTSLNFAAGIYYQLPVIRELAFDTKNQNLKNEKAYHFILGAGRIINEDLKLNAEVYYKKLEDLIVQPDMNSNYAVNSGKGYSYGIDASLIKKFVSNFYGQINYSYSVSKMKDSGGTSYFNSIFNQPNMFNILFGYQLNENWSFSVKWKYATGRPKDAFVIHANVLNNTNRMRYSKEIVSKNSLRYSDYHALNFRVDYRHQFAKYFAVSAFIDIMNLYSRENETGETFEITVGKNKYNSFPMMPTFGFRIEI
jgi:outer membrane receptor protein involved in Fe transport